MFSGLSLIVSLSMVVVMGLFGTFMFPVVESTIIMPTHHPDLGNRLLDELNLRVESHTGSVNLSICKDLSNGFWSPINHHVMTYHHILKHFTDGNPGEALNFSHVWIPRNCRYHRFTNESLHRVVNFAVERNRKLPLVRQFRLTSDGRLNLALIGDSTTRGLTCGLCRLLAGSEIFGPAINAVCGSETERFTMEFNKRHTLDFGPQLRLTFNFQHSFILENNDNYPLDSVLKSAVNEQPAFALLTGTGAWDFVHMYQKSIFKTPGHEECENEAWVAMAKERATPSINASMHQLSDLATAKNIRLVYRNNHYMKRYGTECADGKFEKFLEGQQLSSSC